MSTSSILLKCEALRTLLLRFSNDNKVVLLCDPDVEVVPGAS